MTRDIEILQGRLVVGGEGGAAVGRCLDIIIGERCDPALFEPGGEGYYLETMMGCGYAEGPEDLPPDCDLDISTRDVWTLSAERPLRQAVLLGDELRDLLKRGRQLLTAWEASREDRQFSTGDFPTGSRIGRWQVGPCRSGGPNRGLYDARDPDTGAWGLCTITLSQPGDVAAIVADLRQPGPVLDQVAPLTGPDSVPRMAVVEAVRHRYPVVPQHGGVSAAAVGLCDAVHAAHEEGIVLRFLHRELVLGTPNSLDITARPGVFAARATRVSWGIPPLFETTYLAPELLGLSGPATRASDVFSVAAILSEWTGGQYPFPGETLAQRAMAICAGQWLGLQHGHPELEPVLRAALSVDPASRPPLPTLRAAAESLG